MTYMQAIKKGSKVHSSLVWPDCSFHFSLWWCHDKENGKKVIWLRETSKVVVNVPRKLSAACSFFSAAWGNMTINNAACDAPVFEVGAKSLATALLASST